MTTLTDEHGTPITAIVPGDTPFEKAILREIKVIAGWVQFWES